jgi:hypothetical protein
MDDLNKFQLDNDGNYKDVHFIDNSVESVQGISVYFRDIETKLVSHIREADAILGAVAWLTNYKILDALAELKNVSIIVQKEDFLRPDIGLPSNYKITLNQKYNNLKCNLERHFFDNILSSVSVASDPSIDAVRCVGNHNKDKKPAFPRMHNKFLVFARVDKYFVFPYAVWTGSFNLTKNAGLSLENALYITQPEIVNAYFQEYGQIAAMSEKLDWDSDWAAPEWRIGT